MAAPVIDHLRRSRTFWASVCWIVALVLAAFGFAFLIGGVAAAPLPQVYEAVTRYVPGGLRTYGGLMVAYSLLLIHGLVPPLHRAPMYERWLHYVLISVTVFGCCVVAAFAVSWWLAGITTWQAIVYWASISALAGLAAWFPPDHIERPGRAA